MLVASPDCPEQQPVFRGHEPLRLKQRPRVAPARSRSKSHQTPGPPRTHAGKAKHGNALGNPRGCVSEVPASDYSNRRAVTTYGLRLNQREFLAQYTRLTER